MKEENNKKAGYYDRLIVRVVEQSEKMQQFFIKDVPEAGREDAAETVRRLKAVFRTFENELKDARQACLIDEPIKEAECLQQAIRQFYYLGCAINENGRITDAAKDGYFRELRPIERMLDALMRIDEVMEHDIEKAERSDLGNPPEGWSARAAAERVRQRVKKDRGH